MKLSIICIAFALLAGRVVAESTTNAVTVALPTALVEQPGAATPAVHTEEIQSDEAPQPTPVKVVVQAEAEAPQPQVTASTTVDVGRTWYGRQLRPAELLDRKVRHLRLAQTDAEEAAVAAAEALAKVTKENAVRVKASGVVRSLWFDTGADEQRSEALVRMFNAAHLANQHAEAVAKVQASAADLEAASLRLLGRVAGEVSATASNVRGSVGATVSAATDASAIAAQAKAEETSRAGAVPASQVKL